MNQSTFDAISVGERVPAGQNPVLSCTILAAALLLACGAAGAAERARDIDTLRQGFVTPPREAGPWVYWMFFENVMSKAEITRELEELADAGVAGAELRFLSLHGFAGQPGPWFDAAGWERLGQQRVEYLGPEFLDMLEHTCREAQRLRLQLSLTLGMGWPPGGTWITDAHRSQHLVPRSTVVVGPASLRGAASMAVPPRALVCAWRLPGDADRQEDVASESFQDLSDRVNPQQQLDWDVPDGTWLIGTFASVPGGVCDKGNGPEVDPGSRESVLYHLDHVFARLQPRLSTYFGTTLAEVATDSWEYEPRREARYWSPSLLTMAPQVLGYDLRSRLHALLGYGPAQDEVLADIERLERETIHRHFFATVTQFLQARGLRHRPQVRGRGLARDFFEAFAAADIPEIEEEVFLPEAVWVAHTLGKPIISAEAFTFLSGHGRNLARDGQQQSHKGPLADARHEWETSLAQMRWHAGAHFARGVNRIQMHSFSYSPPGAPPPGWRMYAEVHLNRNVPWWPYLPAFTRWTARQQWLLQAGEPVADALVYPVRANPCEGPYNQASDQPATALNAVDAASRYTFARLAPCGDASCDFKQLVLLDDVRTLDEVDRIQEFLHAGKTVVCCTHMPSGWSALRSPVAAEHADRLESLRLALRSEETEGQIVDARAAGWKTALAQAQSVHWSPADAELSYQHRRVQGGEIYFITNWGAPFSGDVSFAHPDLTPEIWDTDTGLVRTAGHYRITDRHTALTLHLDAHESTIVVFTRARRGVHALHCEGCRVTTDTDGSLVAAIAHSGSWRVDLSDGRQESARIELPPPVPCDGPWTVRADAAQGCGLARDAHLVLHRLVPWQDLPELRTYAGTARYATEFQLAPEAIVADRRWILELGDVFELADVWLNDRHVATSWFPPHRVDVSGALQPGRNRVRVDVPNLLKHYLQPDRCQRPSGLLGPVQLRAIAYVPLTK